MSFITRVNGPIPVSVSFIASSLGISTQCTSITQNCNNVYDGNRSDTCTGYPDITRVPEQQSNSSLLYTTTNGLVRTSQTHSKAFWMFGLPSPLGVIFFGDLLGGSYYLVMACNFTVYNIFVHYSNTDGVYILVNKTMTSGATAAYATYPLCSSPLVPYAGEMNETCPILPCLLEDDLVEMNPSAADF